MPTLRSRNAALLFKLEATEGVDANPSTSTDGILVENPRITLPPQLVNTDEVTGSLDNRGPIVGGIQVQVQFDVYMKHSGTPGTAPEWGKLLQACAWQEVVTAAAVPAAPEACAAGGSTTGANLGASAAGTLQLYRGMPISFTGVVALDTQITDYQASKAATIADTAGAAIVATTNYQIPINVLYKPYSPVPGATLTSGTLYLYMDGLRFVVLGVRGTFTFTVTAGGVGKFSFNMTGQYGSKTDVAVPTPTYQTTRPPVFKSAICKINRLAAATDAITFDNGNTLIYPDNPAATEGFDPTLITRRAMSGRIAPQATLVGTRDIMADLRAGTQRIVHAKWGSVVGNRIAFTVPTALFTGDDPGDRAGVQTEEVPFAAIGQDSGAFLCCF